jgi:hypothetical protein
MTTYYAIVEEVREVEFTFTDEEMGEYDDEFAAANAIADAELFMVSDPLRYVNVYALDDGVE